jgi:hypothetical protein
MRILRREVSIEIAKASIIAWIAVIFLIGARGTSIEADLPVSRELGRGVVSAFYDKQTGERYATIRISRLAQGCQRRGFFRIGVLPELVADGVILECTDSARLATAFANLQNRLRDFSSRAPIELRDFEVCCPTEKAFLLKARQVRISGSECVLFDVTLICSQQSERRTSRATLVLDKDSRCLTLRTVDGSIWKVVASDDGSESTKTLSP